MRIVCYTHFEVIDVTIGERIKQRRLELNLSIENVSEKLGKNRATVYRYESDQIYNMPITTLDPLSKILQCSPAYLMGWEDDEIANLTLKEKKLITAYREQPQMQEAVDKLLNIETTLHKYTKTTFEDDKEHKAAFGGIGENNSTVFTT